jgi:hypothetical protein
VSGPAITILAAHTAREVQVFPTVLNLNLPTGSCTSRFRSPSRVIAEPILGGLHHEYRGQIPHEATIGLFAEDTGLQRLNCQVSMYDRWHRKVSLRSECSRTDRKKRDRN